MKKVSLAGASAVTAMLAVILLPSPAASAVDVPCGDPNFVQVDWHPTAGPHYTDCFAGAGTNWFRGKLDESSWMTHLRTGNNAITFVDCNGTNIDYPAGTDLDIDPAKCVAWINIKPY